MIKVVQTHEAEESAYSGSTYAQCKSLAKSIKTQEHNAAARSNAPFGDAVPSRAVANRLVQAYLRTFQTIFGILHIPLFRRQYEAMWVNPTSVSEAFRMTLMLVMCIGSTFCLPQTGVSRATALQWMHIALTWIRSANQDSRPTMDNLRTMCLLVIARQVQSVSGDMAWLNTGFLLRIAMHLGLHVDPESHPSSQLGPLEIELQRRLWATLVELELQFSMDCGALPGLSGDDYSCAIPLNVDDATLEAIDASGGPVVVKPIDQLTQSSMQILLMQTTPIRLKVARFINHVQRQHPFDDALALSSELLGALKTCSDLISSYSMSSTPPMPFQIKLFDILVQRFMLSLHQSFAIQALSNHSFYYSRKMCLETSLLLSSQVMQSGDDDFYRLRLCSRGPWRVVHAQCALYLCGELMDPADTVKSTFSDAGDTAVRNEMRKGVNRFLKQAAAQIRCGGEKSIKSFVLVSCLLAQANAVQGGLPVHPAVSKALKQSLETSHSLLKSQLNDGLGDMG